jgi:hypothetical protein
MLVFSQLFWAYILNTHNQLVVAVASWVCEDTSCCKGMKYYCVTLMLTKKVGYLYSLVCLVVQHLLSADDAVVLEVYCDET